MKRSKNNCDGDINSFLLHVVFHIGALDDNSFARLRHQLGGFTVIGVGFHGKSSAVAFLCVFTHVHVLCFFVKVKLVNSIRFIFVQVWVHKAEHRQCQCRPLSYQSVVLLANSCVDSVCVIEDAFHFSLFLSTRVKNAVVFHFHRILAPVIIARLQKLQKLKKKKILTLSLNSTTGLFVGNKLWLRHQFFAFIPKHLT